MIQTHLDILGHAVEDKVTGFSGVASSVTFDLYGCIQVIVTPRISDDGKLQEGKWFDIARLKVKVDRVMEPPDFVSGPVAAGLQGAAEKPPIPEGPF